MSAQECAAVEEEFNNLNNNVQILVIIYVICAVSLNFHNMYADIIMLELIISANIIVQNSDYVHKLEQKHSQKI